MGTPSHYLPQIRRQFLETDKPHQFVSLGSFPETSNKQITYEDTVTKQDNTSQQTFWPCSAHSTHDALPRSSVYLS